MGLRMSSLYYHFPSKQDLLAEIMTRSMQDLIATVERAVAAAKGDGPEQELRAAIRGHILFHAERRKEAFVLDNELRGLKPGGRDLVIKLRDRYEQIFADILRDGALQGGLRIRDLRLTVFALLAMCTGVAVWYQPGGRLSLKQIADIYTDLALHGVLATSGREP